MIGIEQINILAKKISDNGVAQQKVVNNVSSLAENPSRLEQLAIPLAKLLLRQTS